ncbi:hypothetical protein M407DRAFT_8361 [Tulasnella calospora MUT 4182]|uniref:HTH CENPB-type domain-containing protein n=1 Tax=Tulasnella calospora MUT 4182 TaxID=1051891 RepID=A0A0C3KVH4_9AGAM|nr:hypothetical protein M407DRAFT_8361 [Tulasnella calospora MUT 4182]
MGRKATTIACRKREERAAQDARMKSAIAHYQKLETTPGSTQMSLRSIALLHKVPHSTLHRLLNGGISISDFNASKRHLTPAENRILLNFAEDQAKRGFPLSHRKLKERANAILQLRKGPNFTVGTAWVSRWLETHSDTISVYWSRGLDRARASGLNPVAVGWYFDTLEGLDRLGIPRENWYGADETGVMLGQAQKTLVIGPAGQKVQHKQQDAEREIVTVMETVCADGTYLPCTVIFKGKNILKKWGRDNACDASIGVAPNGYMDSELALLWLEDFNAKTKTKNDLPRVLIIDGHASHTSLPFLDRAAELNIHAVRDQRERETGLGVRKEDFILLYTAARTATLTPEIIKKAFQKTGAYPVDRSLITESQMAPSTDESLKTNFPADLSSPVKAILAANRVPLTQETSSEPTPDSHLRKYFSLPPILIE